MDLRRLPAIDIEAVGSEPELVARLRAEIDASGPITFARFMERALYEPGLGYYRLEQPGPGRTGDFLTAPETHPVFGRALARQVADVWEHLGRPGTFTVREHGAGEGTLALAILDGLAAEAPDVLAATRYQPVEVEPARVAAFERRLTAAGHGARIEHPTSDPIVGVILANEVLDALPVHRVRQAAAGLEEVYVDWQGDRFVNVAGRPSTPALDQRLADDGVTLLDGQLAEVCLAADAWIADVAATLDRGVLVLLDYGYPAAELYASRRKAGTLLAYVGHQVHDDPLVNVGRQDLTAHVDLTAVDRAAGSAGLSSLGSSDQARFLLRLGIEDDLRAAQQDPTTTPESYLALRSGIARLLDPRATGRFAVLAYGRGMPAGTKLRGFV